MDARVGAKPQRDARIDFFRGLALVFIFVDHIPNNTWGFATLKNFGFADASEVFVLLAGYSAAIAYGAADDRFRIETSIERASRRAGDIYVWHLGIVVLSAILLYGAASVFRDPSYVNDIALAPIAVDPVSSALQIVTLIYQPHYMNILPLYVVLMLWLPVALALLRRSVTLAMILSFAIWALANASGVNLPATGSGEEWFFNPLAWQLLFTTGAAAAVIARRERPVLRLEVGVLAFAYLIFAFLTAAPWVAISFLPDHQIWPKELLGPVNKHYLSVWRYVHILALAYVIAVLIPRDASWLWSLPARGLSRCGRHSMEVFALGTLLSFLGWIALKELGSNFLSEVLVNAAGVGIIIGVAWQLSFLKRKRQRLREATSGGAPASPAAPV